MPGSEQIQSGFVSVVIPCHNQGRFLTQAIESVLAQTYPHVEIIVVDDGSTDETPEVAARYQSQITYRYQKKRGHGASRNIGALAATGEFLHFLDADDALTPNVLDRHVAAAAQNPNIDVFYGNWQSMDADGNISPTVRITGIGRDAFHALLRNNVAPPVCITVRRTLFERGGRFDERLPASEDWDVWLKLAAAGGHFMHVTGSIAYYRNYPGTISRNYEVMWHTGMEVLNRYRRHHRRCLRCAWNYAVGVRKLRGYCCGRCLLPEFQQLTASGERGTAFANLMSAFRHDPIAAAVFPRVMLVSAFRRAFGRGSGR